MSSSGDEAQSSPASPSPGGWGDELELPERVIHVPSPPWAAVAREEPGPPAEERSGAVSDTTPRPVPGDDDATAAFTIPATDDDATAAFTIPATDDDATAAFTIPAADDDTTAAFTIPAADDDATAAFAIPAVGDDVPTDIAPTAPDDPAPSVPATRPVPHERGRDETDPGALRPSAPEPIRLHRVPSRSRRAVARMRAFIGLVLVVILAGVGLAAAVGGAVLVVVFVLQRAFGGS